MVYDTKRRALVVADVHRVWWGGRCPHTLDLLKQLCKGNVHGLDKNGRGVNIQDYVRIHSAVFRDPVKDIAPRFPEPRFCNTIRRPSL